MVFSSVCLGRYFVKKKDYQSYNLPINGWTKVSASELLLAYYKGFWKDRTSAGGGVIIAIRDNLVAEDVDMVEVSTEVIWVKIILPIVIRYMSGPFTNNQVGAQPNNQMSLRNH